MTDQSSVGDPGISRNLTHGMLDKLGREIVIGRYQSGSFPTEAELSKAHGVSRSVTREAMKMLAAKGLVRARPRQGTAVRPTAHWNLFDPDILRWLLERDFSIELLRHFTQLRIAIEPEAAALAARFGEDADHAAILAGLSRMADAERGVGDVLAADLAFHVAILRASKNPFYGQFKDVVATALSTSIRFTNRIVGHSASLAEHGAVADAIIARDADAARAAMRALIGNVLALFEQAEPDGAASDGGQSATVIAPSAA